MKLIKISFVKRLTDSLLNFVETDYRQATNKSDSWLYRMLYDPTDDSDFNFYEQAVSCFTGTEISPRKIQTSLSYKKDVNSLPLITIREVGRSKGIYDGMGGINDYGYLNADNNYGVTEYRNTVKSNYELMVVTDNTLLTLLITDVLYALFIGAWDSLTNEFDLFNIEVKDMMVNQETNTPIYIKSLSISTQYENLIPSIVLDPNVNANNFIFTLTKLDNTEIQNGD
jgi:hypothetical protein